MWAATGTWGTGIAGSAGMKIGSPASWRPLCRRRVVFQVPSTWIGWVIR